MGIKTTKKIHKKSEKMEQKVLKTIGSVHDLALILNCSPRNIQHLAQKGILRKSGHGKYHLLENLHRYLRFLRYQVLFFSGKARMLNHFKQGFQPFTEEDFKKLQGR